MITGTPVSTTRDGKKVTILFTVEDRSSELIFIGETEQEARDIHEMWEDLVSAATIFNDWLDGVKQDKEDEVDA